MVSPPLLLLPSQDINKRLSLPADIRLPDGYLEKFNLNSPLFDKPLSRRLRRVSLVMPLRWLSFCKPLSFFQLLLVPDFLLKSICEVVHLFSVACVILV